MRSYRIMRILLSQKSIITIKDKHQYLIIFYVHIIYSS